MHDGQSWTLRKNEETRLDAFEIKGLRVSWTAKKTNEWDFNKAGVKRELLDTVKARKLVCYGHTARKQGSCLEKENAKKQCQVHVVDEDHAWPDGQHQYVDKSHRTFCERVNQNDREQR